MSALVLAIDVRRGGVGAAAYDLTGARNCETHVEWAVAADSNDSLDSLLEAIGDALRIVARLARERAGTASPRWIGIGVTGAADVLLAAITRDGGSASVGRWLMRALVSPGDAIERREPANLIANASTSASLSDGVDVLAPDEPAGGLATPLAEAAGLPAGLAVAGPVCRGDAAFIAAGIAEPSTMLIDLRGRIALRMNSRVRAGERLFYDSLSLEGEGWGEGELPSKTGTPSPIQVHGRPIFQGELPSKTGTPSPNPSLEGGGFETVSERATPSAGVAAFAGPFSDALLSGYFAYRCALDSLSLEGEGRGEGDRRGVDHSRVEQSESGEHSHVHHPPPTPPSREGGSEDAAVAAAHTAAIACRAPIAALRGAGVPVRRFIATGDALAAHRAAAQRLADVLGERIAVHRNPGPPLLGAAIIAAVAAGKDATGFPSRSAAMHAMSRRRAASAGRDAVLIRPDRAAVKRYGGG